MGFGDYPVEYNPRVHGPYDPARFYGNADTPLGQVGGGGAGVTGSGVGGRYPGGQIGGAASGGYPGSGAGGIGGYPGSQVGGGVGQEAEDEGDAQSLSTITQEGKDVKVLASSQGKVGTGVSQTQLSGSYSGNGSFNAMAQTGDDNKGAQSEISGNSTGISSKAQGRAKKTQTQTQLLMNSDDGAIRSQSQISGGSYSTNSQVQGGLKGGVADAQATGSGSTLSQAQIGFLPYLENVNDNQETLFKGGGSASAQGNQKTGLSQSQIEGAFKYGITYQGAAQSSSGRQLGALPKMSISLDPVQIDRVTNQTHQLTNELSSQSVRSTPRYGNDISARSAPSTPRLPTVLPITPPPISSTQLPPLPESQAELVHIPTKTSTETKVVPLPPLTDKNLENEDYEEEYEDDEETDETQLKTKNNVLKMEETPNQVVTKLIPDNVTPAITLQSGQKIPGTNNEIPSGFRGKLFVNEPPTETQPIRTYSSPLLRSDPLDEEMGLKPRRQSYVTPSYRPGPESSGVYSRLPGPGPDSYITVTKSETGKLKDNNNRYSSTYYTKSSTCGYFTFTCNIIDGRTKICKPNPRYNRDGSLCS
uniref:ATP synthase subunit f, mitochondrial n=1 Tax=Cacopsylla melanoneura TaxID=428564 RepID=A0A8D9ECI5_9HEMI